MTKRRTADAMKRVQVHRVRFRMGDIPHRLVTREELGTKWPLGDVPFVIVAYGSTKPGGRKDKMRRWDHTGFFSYITPDGREHGFKTGHEQSRFSVLLDAAKDVARQCASLSVHATRSSFGYDLRHVSTKVHVQGITFAPRNLAP